MTDINSDIDSDRHAEITFNSTTHTHTRARAHTHAHTVQ